MVLTLLFLACSAPPPARSPSEPPSPIVAAATASPAPSPSPVASPRPALPPSPSLSPSRATAATLAFERDGDIWTIEADGSGARRLTEGGEASAPRWSPDGRRLLLVRGRGMAAELYVMAAEGGPPHRLTSNARPEAGATWSPRGTHVAYSLPRALGAGGALDPREPEEVRVVEVATGDDHAVADGFDPAWSADGARLAYATNGQRRGDAPVGPSLNAIHMVDADGRNDRAVLAIDGVPKDLEPRYGLPFRPATFRLRAPAWSPDGRLLAVSADGHTSMVVTCDERGQDVRVWVPTYEGGVGQARWSPRGDRLAVEVRPATGVDVVSLVEIGSGREGRIGGIQEGLQAGSPTWSSDGRRLALVTRVPPSGRRAELPQDVRTYTPEGAPLAIVTTGPITGPEWSPAGP